DKSISVSLTEGQTKDDVDFGFVTPATAGDAVSDDTNGNGIQNPEEAGITNSTGKLPKTGQLPYDLLLISIGSILIGAGFVLKRNKK
ncbi:LPXTG cell wall anchor domain-containing protein, partial [Terrisporobacter glycolicus]|uniref:LPXTG cell wall anchor domain-containing protein n=1 Tax=Terrisporobacter glycolicus TaxID=36841 RepID=UPI003464ADE2